MGSLARFNLPGLAQVHGLKHFVETGTAQGDSVALACQVKAFASLHSIEIVPELATAAKARFEKDERVVIWQGDSVTCLSMVLRDLPPEPALFWLDAHFPGAHSGAKYDAEPDAKKRLPLEDEIALIRQARDGIRDVLLIDDARIYQPGPYSGGDLPPDWPPLKGIQRDGIGFIRAAFGKTHGVVVDFSDQGYVMVVPQRVLKKAA
jgi:hypothetical protein